jgi:hypothetical protein
MKNWGQFEDSSYSVHGSNTAADGKNQNNDTQQSGDDVGGVYAQQREGGVAGALFGGGGGETISVFGGFGLGALIQQQNIFQSSSS